MQIPFSGGGQRLGDSQGRGSGGYGRAPGDDLDGDWGSFSGGVILAGVLVLVACGAGVLAFLSIGTVPPLNHGIRYNHYTKASDTSTVYPPGRHFIGPFNRFLLFPADVQTIEFTNEPRIRPAGVRYESLHTRTKEGLGLHLQVSMQYRLVADKVGQLYNEFNQNYEQVFTSSVREVLIKAASEYEATDLWRERAKFGDVMQRMVDKELRKTYAECWGLQLMVIDLPDEFENSIVRSEVQKQLLYMKEQEQLSSKIRAETSVVRAEYDRKVKVIMAHGNANYTLTTKEAQAHAQQNKIDIESQVYGMLKQSLHLTPDGLVRYSKYSSMDDLGDASVFYGFQGPSQMLMKANTASSPR